eukprot:3417225-Pleurochrysis_carterae.AAC.2
MFSLDAQSQECRTASCPYVAGYQAAALIQRLSCRLPCDDKSITSIFSAFWSNHRSVPKYQAKSGVHI